MFILSVDGLRKFDRQTPTNMCKEILTPSTWAFSCEVVHKNYGNLFIHVKVTANRISGTFLILDTVYRWKYLKYTMKYLSY